MKRYLFLVIAVGLFSLQPAIASSPYVKITELEGAIYATTEPAKRLQLAEQLLVLGTTGQSYDANPFATAKSGHCAVDVESYADADEKSINMRGLILSAYVLRDQGFTAAINFFEDQLSQTSGVEQDHIRMARLIYANTCTVLEKSFRFPALTSGLTSSQRKDIPDVSKFNTKCFSTKDDMYAYFSKEMRSMIPDIHMKIRGISAIHLYNGLPQDLTEKEIKGEMNIMIRGEVYSLTSKLRDHLRTAWANAGRLRLTLIQHDNRGNERIYFYGNYGNYGGISFLESNEPLRIFMGAGWLLGGENNKETLEFRDFRGICGRAAIDE